MQNHLNLGQIIIMIIQNLKNQTPIKQELVTLVLETMEQQKQTNLELLVERYSIKIMIFRVMRIYVISMGKI
jgi:hypothetical protein